MLLPPLPVEIKAHIFSLTGDWQLARLSSEFFWTIAPQLLRTTCVGPLLDDAPDRSLPTQLIQLYPACGHLVENLTIELHNSSMLIVGLFLQAFPKIRRLRHLTISYTAEVGSHWSILSLPYLDLLEDVISASPNLTRLTFNHTQPTSLLIFACADTLTRLDLGYIFNPFGKFSIPLTHNLEVLSLTPQAANFFIGNPPATLRVLIIEKDHFDDCFITDSLRAFINSCTSVRRVGIVDFGIGMLFFFFSFIAYLLLF